MACLPRACSYDLNKLPTLQIFNGIWKRAGYGMPCSSELHVVRDHIDPLGLFDLYWDAAVSAACRPGSFRGKR